MRERRRLLIAPQRLARRGAAAAAGGAPGVLELEPQEVHYVSRVLRLRPGDGLLVLDGRGGLWEAELQSGGRLQLLQPPELPLRREPPPAVPLELAMAVPRRDADLVWRMATELGADRLQPLLAERGSTGERAPLERWRTIVREAVEQCERLHTPELGDPAPALAWLAVPPPGTALLATTRREGLPGLGQVLGEPHVTGGVTLAIGPEGGWSEAEERAAEAAGWRPVSLGPSILRTGTAAVAGVALLANWRSFSCAAGPRPSP